MLNRNLYRGRAVASFSTRSAHWRTRAQPRLFSDATSVSTPDVRTYVWKSLNSSSGAKEEGST
eukprot:4117629-Alexandrium_andersonii.AAC.3